MLTPQCDQETSAIGANLPAGPSAREDSKGASGPLGNTHGIASPPPEAIALAARLRRYRIQSYVRDILLGCKRENGYAERVAYCLRKLSPWVDNVEVWRSLHRAQYAGLIVCGSPWGCPVCASAISERRRKDLISGIKNWRERGGEVLLITETAPHQRSDALQDLLNAYSNARRIMRHRKPWQRFKDRSGLAGSVRSLEVTWGNAHGWHVHCHEAFFFQDGYDTLASGEIMDRDLKIVKSFYYEMWRDACKTAGLGEPSYKHGISVQDGSWAAKYASKWGLEDELTKSAMKHARGGNYAPFDMADAYGRGYLVFGPLFREYYHAFKDRKQLHWSDGMRSIVDLGDDPDDGDLAALRDEGSELLGKLNREDWAKVVAAEKRGLLLEVAYERGWPGVLELVASLANLP